MKNDLAFQSFRLYILIITSVLPFSIKAQDIHFSQFDAAPLNLNPAQSGNFDGQYRFVLNHKNQWQAVTNAYTTYSFSVDSRKNFGTVAGLGYGLVMNADKAGDANFGTMQIGVPLTIRKNLLPDSSLTISIGIQPQYSQISFNFAKFTFNSQFDGNKYNPDLSHNQHITNEKLSYFDLQTGVNLHIVSSKRVSFDLGASVYHVNTPTLSFASNSAINLDRKWILHGLSSIGITPVFTFFPSFIYMIQGNYREFNVGGLARFNTNSRIIPAVYFGGWFRIDDAAIIKAGIDYSELNIGISYDINTSSLNTASNGRGGLEIAITYILDPPKVMVPPYKSCPAYF